MNEPPFPERPILVIDDDEYTLESIEFALEFEGVNNLILCRDPRKAEKKINDNNVGLVLLDLRMPHISGQELFKHIKENYPHIPIIVLTGVIQFGKMYHYILEHAFDFLYKPLTGEEVLRSIKKAIDYISGQDN
jgi:DNA-binding NtrC family response regulator